MITRRQMLKLSWGAAVTLILPACSANSLPLTASGIPKLTKQPPGSPLGLATSLKQEYTYQAVVEGKIPQELRGTLYRNGPGLFERNGVRKRSLLDGDGMVQAYHIRNDNVEYRNRFTRTAKFIEEEASGEFRYGGWTTQAPGGVFSNLFASGIKNQAGVSVVRKNNRLYAFDESIQPYELHPETLETVGLSHLGLPEDPAVYYAAHSKTDSKNGDWCHFGLQYGRNIDIYFTVFHASGKLKKKWIFESPRYVYLHDYFVTENYFILNLHPAKVNIFGFLFGLRNLTDSFEWQPEKWNMLVLLKRDGSGDPLILETETAWMWHSLNAYKKNGEIIADFVGYENPDHFIGDDPTFSAIMSGRSVVSKYNGEIRRYRIDIKNKRIQQTVLDQGSHEFPIVNPQHSCHTHRYGYFAAGHGKADASLFSQIKRLDFQSGKTAVYNFGEGYFCGEPVFAPKPDFRYNPESAEEPGWILTQVYDSHTHKNFLAVLDAEHLADGPLALIHHTHHLPFGLHGWWSGISWLKCFSQSTVVKKGTVDKSQFVCPSGASAGCQPILDELYARQLAEAENWKATSLGGTNRLRGYRTNRFYDSYSNFRGAEFRWYLHESQDSFNFLLEKGTFAGFQMAFFYEEGTVANNRADLWQNLRTSYGVGTRFIFNSIIVRIDRGFSKDEGGQTTFFVGYPF